MCCVVNSLSVVLLFQFSSLSRISRLILYNFINYSTVHTGQSYFFFSYRANNFLIFVKKRHFN